MKLLDDIIEMAADDKEPIGNLLRKCLILESQFSNEAFRSWLDKELDGYDKEDELPSYRSFHAISYGLFIGLMGRQLTNQPLSLHILDEADRKRVASCPLTQPATSYEGRPDKMADAQLPWNPVMTTKYQSKFFKDSDFVLNRAWQLIPGSILVALTETVRNRVLRFALDLKHAAGNQAVSSIPKDTVENSITKHILEGKKFDWT